MPRVICPETTRHDRRKVQVSVDKQIAYLRNSAHALEILSRGEDPARAQLCIICVHDRDRTCPFEENRPLGACLAWVLDDKNPAETLERLENFLKNG